jgi:potassium-transporting ATPase KdpC subunit
VEAEMIQLKRSLLVFVGLSVICGLIYPLVITVISQSIFPRESNASLIKTGERIIGSDLIGQQFTSPKYFHGRPSATDPPYDASNSGGSNLASTSAKLIEQAKERIAAVRKENDLGADASVPADLVLTSASGLDPHISPGAALLQIGRIAKERKMPETDLRKMIQQNTEKPFAGFWGKERVNVLQLNLALDGIKMQK